MLRRGFDGLEGRKSTDRRKRRESVVRLIPWLLMASPPAADPSGPATGITPGSTYVDTLKANPRPSELAARAAKKAKTIFLSKEEDEYMDAPFQYALVGKFSHGYPTMTRLRAKFAAPGLNNGFKIGVLDHKHVWIRLFDPNDYARIWMKQTWYFEGFPMRVLKWSSDFNPAEESPIMPIWIKVFGLRPHWFHRRFLYHIASLVGKPIKLDEATTEIDNPIVARICVEINVLEKLQPDVPIQIDGRQHYFKVQYEEPSCIHVRDVGSRSGYKDIPLKENLLNPIGAESIKKKLMEKDNDINDLNQSNRTENMQQDLIFKVHENPSHVVDGLNVTPGLDFEITHNSSEKEKTATEESLCSTKAPDNAKFKYTEELRRDREKDLVATSSNDDTGQQATLGRDVEVPAIFGVENTNVDNEEGWQEVNSKHHRRASSYDEHRPKLNAKIKQLTLDKRVTRNLIRKLIDGGWHILVLRLVTQDMVWSFLILVLNVILLITWVRVLAFGIGFAMSCSMLVNFCKAFRLDYLSSISRVEHNDLRISEPYLTRVTAQGGVRHLTLQTNWLEMLGNIPLNGSCRRFIVDIARVIGLISWKNNDCLFRGLVVYLIAIVFALSRQGSTLVFWL
ncbi:hypothetical protein BUALT_Bualt01G0130500 [Buddleja alternifolia]|uniref:DUF4283 domain-containing protein n=1 Tax=Buddleja alternifolia TaxID=168488 RepID=A0AAV6YDQ6_9LAMI|nr:hypothetical protein BUALT_Bualt01G0130500 [Buddleja alternifolia]